MALDVTVTPFLQSRLIKNAAEKRSFVFSAADDRKYEQ